MKRKRIFHNCLAMVMALIFALSTSNVFIVYAAEDDSAQTVLLNGREIELKSNVNLDAYDEGLSELEFYDEENGITPRAGISVRYYWNYNTYPYNFSQQTWSTNVDIYDTYTSTNEAEYLNPKLTYTLTNPTSLTSYRNAIREGYIREAGEMQLYDHIVSGVNNNVMLMMDNNIMYDILEKNTLDSIFSENSSSLIGGTTETRTIDNKTKNIVNIQLQSGEYLILFSANNVASNNHYAMYTGCPLPLAQTSMVAGTHNGVAHWNGGGLNAEREVICPSVNVSVPSGVDPSLFALHKVRFENRAISSAQDLYASSVKYYYASPANSSYRLLSEESGYHGDLYDNTPSACSVQGNYRTKFYVTWSSTLAYVSATYSANTIMHIEYLVPYGLYQGM